MAKELNQTKAAQQMATGMSLTIAVICFVAMAYSSFTYGGLMAPVFLLLAWGVARMIEKGTRYLLTHIIVCML